MTGGQESQLKRNMLLHQYGVAKNKEHPAVKGSEQEKTPKAMKAFNCVFILITFPYTTYHQTCLFNTPRYPTIQPSIPMPFQMPFYQSGTWRLLQL
jgi:hypothetical protein